MYWAVTPAGTPSQFARVCKVDTKHGIVLGWAIVCKQDGADYFDLQDEVVPEEVMFAAAVEFAEGLRTAREMHRDGSDHGQVPFVFPMTSDVAKALGIDTDGKSGMLVGMKPGPDVLKKFESGEYTGFSIGGRATYEEVTKALIDIEGNDVDEADCHYDDAKDQLVDSKGRPVQVKKDYDESKHPRDEGGKWGSGGSPKVGDHVKVSDAGGKHAGKTGFVSSVSRGGDLAGVDHADGSHGTHDVANLSPHGAVHIGGGSYASAGGSKDPFHNAR